MAAELIFYDMQPVIDNLVRQAVEAAIDVHEHQHARRVVVRGVMAGTPASEIVTALHRGSL